jgi:hypothetical protein
VARFPLPFHPLSLMFRFKKGYNKGEQLSPLPRQKGGDSGKTPKPSAPQIRGLSVELVTLLHKNIFCFVTQFIAIRFSLI